MAINPLLPILIGAIQTRNVIKDQNEAEYDEVTGAFIDAAATEFFADKANQKKRIENNEKFYKATEARYGTNVAEFAAKNNLFEGYVKPAAFLNDIEGGTIMPVEFRNKLRGTKEDDSFFKSQGFKTTFAQDQNLAKQKLEDKTLFAANNLNKGAVSNLADLYLGTTTEKPSKLKSFLFGKETPDVTKMAAGFEAGLDATAEKSVVKPEETTSVADASSLAADTNLIDQKLGFEKNISIGSTREVDAAIASIFNLDNVQIGPEGIIFPEAYRLRALAIKDVAADLVQSGKYEGDTTTLINDAANFIEQEYFSKLPIAFSNYSVTSKPGEVVNAKSEFSVDSKTDIVTLGTNFNTIFGSFADNPDTPDITETLTAADLILKQDVATAGTSRSKAVQATGAKFMMTDNAYNAMENYIQSMPNVALQKAFIQYLPKNLMINVQGNVVPIANRLNSTFGFTTF
tara:strand:+ start:1701 stop:3077 length:1377 start_codon:yes stop_codon:yes gene_type:complete